MYGVNESSKNKVSLRELRNKLKMNQTEFAALIGSDQSEVSRIENGRSCPEWYVKALRLDHAARKAGLSLGELALTLPDPDELPEVKP
jgi:DNA-binding XRE family transcriptional regulator